MPFLLCRTKPDQPSTSALVAVTSQAHEARLARASLHALQEYDTIERQHNALQHVRWCTFSLGAGFAFAVFPFTPGVVDYCKPTANPGWLCGARAAAFLSACEATLVGIAMGTDLLRDFFLCDREASRISLALGRLNRRDPGWPSELMRLYRKGDANSRERVKALLRRPFPVEAI